MKWIYASLTDDTKPEGEQLLGGYYIQAVTLEKLNQPVFVINMPEGKQLILTECPDAYVPEDHKLHGRLLSAEVLNSIAPHTRYGDL